MRVLPRGHRDGQAARADHRPRHLLDAAHGRDARRPRLVHRAGDAGQPRLPDGAADQERSDAVVPDDGVSGPRPGARAVRLQGRRSDVGVLPAARRHRRRRQADRALRRSDVGVPAVPARRARRAAGRRDPGRGRRDASRACAAAASSLPSGHGAKPSDMDPALDRQVRRLYEDAKLVHLRRASRRHSRSTLADAVPVATRSRDRDDYILHPPTGEALDEESAARSARCATRSAARSTCRS